MIEERWHRCEAGAKVYKRKEKALCRRVWVDCRVTAECNKLYIRNCSPPCNWGVTCLISKAVYATPFIQLWDASKQAQSAASLVHVTVVLFWVSLLPPCASSHGANCVYAWKGEEMFSWSSLIIQRTQMLLCITGSLSAPKLICAAAAAVIFQAGISPGPSLNYLPNWFFVTFSLTSEWQD